MASSTVLAEPQYTREPILTIGRRRQLLRVFTTIVMVIYTVLTIFPFYALFVRSFVPTKESADLHLWLPEVEEVSMNAEVRLSKNTTFLKRR
jgi:ABC-type glycerol-3-phosphate transport system permease component